ncbi:MAG: chlorophyll a/b-binding protein [Cyanobacteriota bacterium]|nr:chlorophyll a/b-binding protein [Cyanobacteriota bacterium]
MNAGQSIDKDGKLNYYAIEPKIYVEEQSRAGFTEYAEKLNGRLAMLGFVSLVAFEALAGKGLIAWFANL